MRTKGSKNKIKVKEEKVEQVMILVQMPEVPEVKVLIVPKVAEDFGREDLNKFRDRFNELVEKLSK